MGMTTRHTSAANLQKALDQKLVTIKSVTVESKDDHSSKTIPAEQFKNDLEFYVESGIFSDSLDFKYELSGNNLAVDIGFMSSFCDSCITVAFCLNFGASREDLEKVLRKVED